MFIAVPIAWLTLYKVLRETEEGRKPRGWSEERWESEKGDRRGEREREKKRESEEKREEGTEWIWSVQITGPWR